MPGKTVLIVEDDPVTRQVLHTALKEKGYGVVLAVDANGALTAAQKNRPDLVVLDLGLPAGGGFGFLNRLRMFPALQMIPVIVVSGQDRAANEPRARDAGASEYLEKPVRHQDVVAAAQRLIGGP